MPLTNPFKPKPTISDLQERNDELKIQADNEELELSIAQRKALREKLKAQGLSVGMFGGVKNALKWLKSH